jgi:hypothetical protein
LLVGGGGLAVAVVVVVVVVVALEITTGLGDVVTSLFPPEKNFPEKIEPAGGRDRGIGPPFPSFREGEGGKIEDDGRAMVRIDAAN